MASASLLVGVDADVGAKAVVDVSLVYKGSVSWLW